MTQVPFIPETAPFTPEQRAWLNSFLAGWFSVAAGPASATVQSNGSHAANAEPLLILFGSQTGTAEALAKRLAKESEKRGFAPRILALNDYEQAGLTKG